MGLMKKLTSGLVAASLVFGLVGTAFADLNDSAAVKNAADRLVALKVVDGTGNGLELGSNLTRAQLVKIIVTAFGQKDTAALLVSAPSFADVKGHWAAGYIALAKAKAEQAGIPFGYADGTFKPENSVTFAEALGLIEKFMGIKPTAGLTYPNDVIDAAVNAGIIDAKDKATLAAFPNQAINRGQAFYLADTAFAKPLNGEKSVYQKYDSITLPTVSVDEYKSTVMDSSVTLTGTVKNATELKVAGQAVTFDASGKWTVTVKLDKVGKNDIAIEAKDLIGNVATPASAVSITRAPGAAYSIDASLSAATVEAGGTATLTVKVLDKTGAEIPNAEVTVVPDAAVGTYDAATATLTAAKTPATGNLTITVKGAESVTKVLPVTVSAGALATVVADTPNAAPGTRVTLTAQDANGNAIKDATFALAAASSDAYVLPGGTFFAFVPGSYTVNATSNGVTKSITVGVYSSTVAKYQVTTAAAELIANKASTTTLTVKALDANGNVIANNADTVKFTTTAFNYIDSTGAAQSLNGYTAALTNGALTLTIVSANSQGSITAPIAVNKNGAVSTTTQTTANVALKDQVAQSVSVARSTAAFVNSSSTSNHADFDVKVLDQAGKPMLSGYYALSYSITGPATTAAGGSTTTSTTYYNPLLNPSDPKATVSLYPKQNQSGVATVTVTGTNLGSASDTVTAQLGTYAATFTVSPASTAATYTAAGVSVVRYNLQATDPAGVPMNLTGTHAVKVTFAVEDSAVGQIYAKDGAAVDMTNPANLPLTTSAKYITANINADGTGYFTVQANKFIGSLSMSFADTNASALAAPGAVVANFVADKAAGITAKINGQAAGNYAVAATGAPAVTLTGQLVDKAGNPVALSGEKVTFAALTATAPGVATDVKFSGIDANNQMVTDANGQVTTTVSLGNYVGAVYPLTVSYKTATVQSNISVANSVAANVNVGLYTDSDYATPLSSVTAGTKVYAKATVTDANGRPIPNETLKVTIPTDGGTISEGTVTLAQGDYEWTFTPQSAPSVTFNIATSGTTSPASTSVVVGVRPDFLNPAKFAVAGGNQNITTASLTAVTVNLADGFGNVTANNTNYDRTITVSAAFTNTGANAGKHIQMQAVSGGLVVSTQSTSGATDTSSATFTVPRGADHVTFYVVTDLPVGATFTLTATDSTGNNATLFTAGSATFTVK